MTSVKYMLVVAGSLAFVLGALIFIFIRDLDSTGLLTMGIGLAILGIAVIFSWRQVARAIFGRRGRYGVNTLIIVSSFVILLVLGNFVFWWLSDQDDPPGWLRTDVTTNNQFGLSEQTVQLLADLGEPIRATVFLQTNTAERAAAWRDTQDLLSEFARRAADDFDIRLVDPILQPNVAVDFGVTQTPAIAIEATDSRRTDVVVGGDPLLSPDIFDEQGITTALLVVNQVRQKQVYFVSGHGERDITTAGDDAESYVQAALALIRDNYRVSSSTLIDLLPQIFSSNPDDFPAALIFAGPVSGLVDADGELRDETDILRQYMLRGGSAIFLFEPDPHSSYGDLLGEFGVAIGTGHLVDTSSFVAPEPDFLQITKRQFSDDHPITAPLDVVYMPGATFIGRTITNDAIPRTNSGEPHLILTGLASTSLSSWEELSDTNSYEINVDRDGPFPVAVAVEALAPIGFTPQIVDGEPIRTNIVVIGDADFASDRYFSSATNGDFLANAVNWAARDFELISIRSKTKVSRELVLFDDERSFVRWSGWLLMPSLISAVGVWAWWRRR
ncbi:MAG: GldG family protein [Chloroflexi bacterium]|nr:GldG family protein [Chloroflexota bacterium]